MAKRRKSKGDDSLFGDPSNQTPAAGAGGGQQGDAPVALHEAAQTRYLNYALSVITSRALPDVRDGLKPVQRRILFTMGLLGLRADAKHRKCANVVGEVMGKYHPHGDSAIYDALVRMAQPFVMRHTLVDGSGNFGSLDGDPPAAMRYTECRLAPIAGEMLGELGHGAVHHRPTYDNARNEPVVLPAKVPNLLVNGSSGIAVGMATNIPPHNLEEVCSALVRLIDDPELSSAQLARTVKGPDFPTGGQIINSRDELRDIYKTGQGAVRMRGTWEKGPVSRAAQTLYITSVPYGVNKAVLVEQIAQVVLSRKMPLLLDVKDVSTDDVRIELQLKKDADQQKVMAYLFRHTLLQTNFNVNLTCLVPTENPEVGRPQRCELREVLSYFLHFRLEVVTRRLQHELDQLNRRIHILEGFELIFDALDEIIKIIRASDGKADAAAKIIKRFKLDEEQTDAILELKLYRLAKLEILVIQEELAEKRKRVKQIKKLLDETAATGRWKIVRDEIEEISKTYGSAAAGGKRRTVIEGDLDEPEFSAEDFIIAEDSHVLVTADGWVKRQKEINPDTTRLREGDRILTVEAGSTRATMAFFSNFGAAYSCRVIDLPATTGYGEPIQKLFKLKDAERIIAAFSMDPRSVGEIHEDPKRPDYAPLTHGFAATSDGYALRFGLKTFAEPSTRSGRRYARPAKGSEVVYMTTVHGRETIIAASRQRRAILCRADDVNYLSGPGKGVQLIRLSKDDRLLAALAALDDRDTLTVKTSMGGEQRINTGKYKTTGRGGRGHEIIKRGQLVEALPQEVPAPVMLEEGD